MGDQGSDFTRLLIIHKQRINTIIEPLIYGRLNFFS